jgi:rubrerythrin
MPKKILYLASFLVTITVAFICSIDAQLKYQKTIQALQILYEGECRANLTYSVYAQKAISEDYPNIAHLFQAFSASESIHARNFKKHLLELGVEVKEIPKPEIEVKTTKYNLAHACETELKEIDQYYPEIVERIKPEKHEAAIRDIEHAWQAEKQHRDLIEKVQSGTGFLFKVLAKVIEKKPTRYFICQNCGSTLTALPNDECPICKGPVSHYKEIKRGE